MYNEITCVGWVGKNVDQKVIGNGRQLVKFQIGCQRDYTKKNSDGSDVIDQNGNKQRETDWLNVCCWGKTAEIVTKLGYQTGDLVMVTGRVEVSKYTAQDQTPRTSWDINANKTLILKRKNGNGQSQGGAFNQQPQQQSFGQQQQPFGQQPMPQQQMPQQQVPQQQMPQQQMPAPQGNFNNFNNPQNFQPQQSQQQPFGTAQQAPASQGGFGAQTPTNFGQ